MKNIFKRKNKSKDIEIIESEDGGTISCGGRRRTIDNRAEKTIVSTEIVNFELEFSLTSYVLDEEERINGFYGAFFLTCKRTENGVECHYKQRKRFGPDVTEDFITDVEFLAKLDKIVKEEDFASLNGYSSRTSGLPEMFGNDLTIDYASGENIYTYNNQSIDLPIDGLRRVKELFDSAMKDSKKVNQAAKKDEEPEDFPTEWQCGKCGAINQHSLKNCSYCGLPKPNVDPIAQCPCGLDFYGKVPDTCPKCGLDKEDFF